VKVLKTINAGDHGSQKYLRVWGDKLLNVRYREDQGRNIFVTTIEIVVDQRAKPPKGVQQRGFLARRASAVVGVQINYSETELRLNVKSQGGIWDKTRRLWLLRHAQAIALGLKDRVVEFSPEDCPDLDILDKLRHGQM
jgi:hypothetical protein